MLTSERMKKQEWREEKIGGSYLFFFFPGIFVFAGRKFLIQFSLVLALAGTTPWFIVLLSFFTAMEKTRYGEKEKKEENKKK